MRVFVKDFYKGFASSQNEAVRTHFNVWSREAAGLLWGCICVCAYEI